jgi:hypothetical protein
MGHIFLSYSRRQLYFAESIVLNLQRAGLEIWFDLQKLTPGVEWASALKDGYSNCDRLILVASQFAIQSPYVRIEWETALANRREVIVVLTEPWYCLRPAGMAVRYTRRGRSSASIAHLRGEDGGAILSLPGKSPYTDAVRYLAHALAMFTPTSRSIAPSRSARIDLVYLPDSYHCRACPHTIRSSLGFIWVSI